MRNNKIIKNRQRKVWLRRNLKDLIGCSIIAMLVGYVFVLVFFSAQMSRPIVLERKVEVCEDLRNFIREDYKRIRLGYDQN